MSIWPRAPFNHSIHSQGFPIYFCIPRFFTLFAIASTQRPSIPSDYLFAIIIIVSRTKQLNHDTKQTFSLHLHVGPTIIRFIFTHQSHGNWWSHIDSETQFPKIIHNWEQPSNSPTHNINRGARAVFSIPHKTVKYRGESLALSSRELCILDTHLWFSFIKFYWIKTAQIFVHSALAAAPRENFSTHQDHREVTVCILCSAKMWKEKKKKQ